MPSEKRARQRAGRQARVAELRRTQERRRRYRRYGVVAVIVLAAIGLAIYTGTSHSSKKATTSTAKSANAAGTSSGPTACPKPDGSSPRILSFGGPPPMCIDPSKHYTATFTTSQGATQGTVVVALDTAKTPQTTNNFVVLARYHYFDNTQLFRTDTSIGIIQGGSPHTETASDPGPGYMIKDEGSGYTYAPGDLVMARQSSPNSAGAQFFFCASAACSQLNAQGTYVVFGHASSGLDVLGKVLASNVNNNSGLGGAPNPPVTVKTVTISQS